MKIIGAGGGGKGGGGGGATIASDSLRSKAFARVLDLISEGEIEGLVDGAKSIYLDDTPLQNADGTFNFRDASWESRNGTQTQSYIPGFPSVESTNTVGVEVKAAASVTRQFTNPNLNALRVTVGVPALTNTDSSTGSVYGTTVSIAIDVQTAGGGFVRQDLNGAEVITGKTSSRYQRSYRIPLTGTGPWDVRVVRLTPDSTTDLLQNKTFWDSVTEIVDTKLRYPNSALVGINIDASQFSNIPTRSYDVKLLRVRVPVNYDPETRSYTGSWDGTFKIAWTDNPAWCFYDLVTTQRYGLGEFIGEAQVDKWALYAIGQYCDELVPDGFGGMEPRFTCNIYMQTRAEAYRVVNDFASIFRGMVFWATGAITAVQDSPADAAYLYTAANVVDGMFTYSGASAKARHTVALVTWNDPDDGYRQKVEYVEDAAGIARYGVITTELAAMGCTSRGQANRAGRWLLYSERLETETVAFKAGVEGMICRPGQVIKVADPSRAGVRRGGRLIAAAVDQVTLDAAVTLTAGEVYTLATIKADGTVQEATVVHSGGSLTVLPLSPSFGEAPAVGSVWMLSSVSVEPQTFRVISVIENEKHEFEITALAHDPSKYDAIEQGLVLQPRSISVLTGKPPAPQGLVLSDTLYASGNGLKSKLLASWQPVAGAKQYVLTYQEAGGNVSPEIVVTTPSVEIPDVSEGVAYTVTVLAVSAINVRGQLATASRTVLGKVGPPANVQNFYVVRNGDLLNFTWLHVPDADRDRYEIRQGQVWGTATEIGATSSNSFSFTSQRGGTFLIKAVDTSGNYSVSEAAVIAPDLTGINVVLDYNDSVAGFTGTHDNTASLGLNRPLQWFKMPTWDLSGQWDDEAFVGSVTLLDTGTTWADLTDPWDAYAEPWLFTGEPVTAGTYTTQPIDIGYVATCVLSLEAGVETLSNGATTWADFTQPWSAYGPPDWSWQGLVGAISAAFEVSTSEDGVTWSNWQPFILGAYSFRYVRLRVNLGTVDPNYRPYLTTLILHIDVPDRVEHFEDVAVPPAGVTILFSPAFVGVRTVQATLQSAVSGDRFTVTGKTDSQVTINVYDSAGAAKAGVVDVDVFGFGVKG